MPEQAGTRQHTKVQGAVELGPRSMALLRRIVKGLEILADSEIPDPGIDSEFENEDDS